MKMGSVSGYRGRLFYGWWVVGASMLIYMVMSGAGFYSFGLFIKPLGEEFGWSRGAVSASITIFFGLSGLLSPLVGRLADLYSLRRMIAIGALIFGGGFFLLSLINALWQMYLIYALLAVGQVAMGILPISALIARWFEVRRGLAMGIAMVGIGLGGLTMAPGIGFVISHWDWRTGYLTLGIISWALTGPALLVLRDSPAQMGLLPDGRPLDTSLSQAQGTLASVPAAANGMGLREALRTPAFWWLALAFTVGLTPEVGVLQHQVPYVTDAGFSRELAALVAGVTAGVGGLGKLAFGYISDRVPARLSIPLCFAMQAAGLGVLMMVGGTGLLWLHAVLFGFAMGAIPVLMAMAVSQLFGLAAFGVILGSLSVAQSLGVSFGPLMAGAMYDAQGTYRWVFIIFLVAYGLAVVAAMMARPPRGASAPATASAQSSR